MPFHLIACNLDTDLVLITVVPIPAFTVSTELDLVVTSFCKPSSEPVICQFQWIYHVALFMLPKMIDISQDQRLW